MDLGENTEYNQNFVTLRSVVDLQSGFAFKKSEYSITGVRLFQIANVSFNFIKWEEIEYLPSNYLDKVPHLVIHPGDILMALNRPLLNNQLKIAQIKAFDAPSILYQRVGRFKFTGNDNHKFLLYFLQSPVFIKWLEEQLQGVNIPFINKSKLLNFDKYPRYTKEQQDRIVEKIEELSSELDKGIENLKTAQQQLKVYRQAVLKWAFEGIESRASVGKLFDFIGGGTPSKKEFAYWNGNINWASVKDVKGDFLNETQDKITEQGLKNSASNVANPNDVILITRISPGKVIITNIPTAVNQDLKIIKPKFKTTSRYVYYLFKSIEGGA